MINNQQVKRLVVLGNGFDRACDVNSTFEGYLDYFDDGTYKIQAVKDARPPAESELLDFWKSGIDRAMKHQPISEHNPLYKLALNYPDNCPETIWDAILILDMDRLENWQDIETKIKEIITDPKIHLLDSRKTLWPDRQIREDELEQIYIAFLACYCFEYDMRKQDFLGFLYEQLHSFELGFVEYMGTQTGHGRDLKTDYLDKSTRLFSWLTEDDWSNVLNFNYSLPAAENWNEPTNYARALNIHGDLNRNIIIGIDQNGTRQDSAALIPAISPLYRFTKTYRLMNDAHDYAPTTVLDPNIKTIAFFGHSFSHADYSYFQSIFDFYEIYGSQVILKFFYYVWDNDRADEIKAAQFTRIASLFQSYGETLDNKDHGKNMMHKLLLERRLQIIRIRDVFKDYDYPVHKESVYGYLG